MTNERRRFLRLSGLILAGAVAGCASGDDDDTRPTSGTTAGTDSGTDTPSVGTGSARSGPSETGGGKTTGAVTDTDARFDLTSSAFAAGETIPRRFTCAGANVSPPLAIAGVPGAAETLALVVDDPDAGSQPFTHWLLWNLPPGTTTLPTDVPGNRTVSALGGARQGTNDGGGIGYTGPCPPTGDAAHTYRFRLYALDSRLGVEPGADRGAVEDALADSKARRTLLRGVFSRN